MKLKAHPEVYNEMEYYRSWYESKAKNLGIDFLREVDHAKVYGPGRWRKLKGITTVRLKDGFITKAELHWYECHGIGKKEFKIKRYLD